MLEFLKIFLLAKTIMLTSQPIDIYPGRFEIGLKEPISAITEGAALYVDVSSMLPDDVKRVSAARSWVRREFPPGFLTAVLLDSSGDNEVLLVFVGESSWSSDEVRLILSAGSGMPTKVEYDKLVLETDIALYDVSIIWKNYKK
ncbi:MAG: hypothetical protein LC667_12210 [Thioalkalivibrio sp.]|nr:hypothetical protein [Thioalkalivibrio sp.]